MPNTAFQQTRLTVVNGPTVTWIEPPAHVVRRSRATGSSSSPTRRRRSSQVVVHATTASAIGVDKTGPGGVYSRRLEDGRS